MTLVHPLLSDGTVFTTSTLPRMNLIYGSIANETLGVSEGHIAGRGAVALVVRNDLYPVILPHAHAAAYSRKIKSQLIPACLQEPKNEKLSKVALSAETQTALLC